MSKNSQSQNLHAFKEWLTWMKKHPNFPKKKIIPTNGNTIGNYINNK